MQHYIRSITQELLNKITDEQMHYTPADLQEAGFPPYLVERISLEIQRNLADSVSLPDSDWADMQADHVQDAWDNFLVAIRAETRIPASYLRSVVENAVEDILELLAEPERTIQETLFRQEKMASVLELQVRRQWIVTNGHLADAVLRYMNRKGLTEISREKAANIIRQIDLHLASGYTPLKWGQALDIWFRLMGQAIPSAMLTRYFADKGLLDIAKRFEHTDEVMSRSRLIEYLSMPDLNWGAADEDDLPGFTPVLPYEPKDSSADENLDENDDESNNSLASLYSPQDEEDSSADDDLEDENDNESNNSLASLYSPQEQDSPTTDDILEDDDDESNSSLASLYSPQDEEDSSADDDLEDENDDESNNSLASLYSPQEQDSPTTDDDLEDENDDNPLWNIPSDFESEQDEKDSLLNQFLSEIDSTDQKSNSEPINFGFNIERKKNGNKPPYDIVHDYETVSDEPESVPVVEEQEITDVEQSDDTTDAEVIPIWQRFLTADQDEEAGQSEDTDESFEIPGDSSRDDASETSNSIATPGAQLNEEARLLLSYLNQNKQLLIDELFGGDNQFFYDSLNELAGFENWSQAGRHLTREIFIPNDIDMYSGEAVLFVDLLQQYYEENK